MINCFFPVFFLVCQIQACIPHGFAPFENLSVISWSPILSLTLNLGQKHSYMSNLPKYFLRDLFPLLELMLNLSKQL